MEKLAKNIWKGCEVEAVDSEGESGGLTILWDPNKWTLVPFLLSSIILTMSFKVLGPQSHGFLSNSYGPHPPFLKREFIEAMNHLGNSLNGQDWVIGGDFNIIIALWEKKSNLRRLEGESDSFREWISSNKLVDIHTNNGMFTWTNKRGLERNIAMRLDRFLTSESLFRSHQAIATKFLPFFGSDHWLAILTWEETLAPCPQPFHMENLWMEHQDFFPNIESWWGELPNLYGKKMFQFQQRLKHVKLQLNKWNKEVFGNIFEEKNRLE